MHFFILILVFSSCSSTDNQLTSNQQKVAEHKRTPASIQKSCSELLSNLLSNMLQKRSKIDDNKDVLRWKLKKGNYFLVHQKGSSSLEQVRFQGIRIEENETILLFKRKGDGKILEIKANDIHSTEQLEDEEGFSNIINSVIMQPILADTMGKLVFKPYRPLVKTGTIEVVGNLLSSKKLGQTLADNMNGFDDTMTSLGFIKPESTRVIVNDTPILPSLKGPFSLNYPTLNIWTGKFKKVIAMNPIFWKTNSVKNEAVLHHERMHALLYRTYNNNAFINKSKSFQEAFADFSAANFLDDPQVGYEVFDKGVPLRDISRRTTQYGKTKKTVDLVTKVTGYDYHDDSLLVSNLLWRIRGQLGKDKTSELMKPLIDDLNTFRKSFLELETDLVGKIEEPKQGFVNDLEYLFATLKKKAQDDPSFQAVNRIVDDYVVELGLDSKKIDGIASQLKSGDESFEFTGEEDVGQAISVVVYGTAGVLVEGYFIYEIFFDDD